MKREESVERLVTRLKAEFLEMPGLKLTEAQARKLWALDEARCAHVLDTLVRTEFLFRTRDGAFMRIERVA
jgi:hypothetical protein